MYQRVYLSVLPAKGLTLILMTFIWYSCNVNVTINFSYFQLLLKCNINLSEITDLILNQSKVGSVIKVSSRFENSL